MADDLDLPSSGVMTPSSIISVVVLPAPLGPRSATRSPAPTVEVDAVDGADALVLLHEPRRGEDGRAKPRIGLGHAVSVARRGIAEAVRFPGAPDWPL